MSPAEQAESVPLAVREVSALLAKVVETADMPVTMAARTANFIVE
jgi:hypothetical protein